MAFLRIHQGAAGTTSAAETSDAESTEDSDEMNAVSYLGMSQQQLMDPGAGNLQQGMEFSEAEKACVLTLERVEKNDEMFADMNILANEAYTAYAKDAAKPQALLFCWIA